MAGMAPDGPAKPRLTGDNVDYYLIPVHHPKRLPPHVTEVEDIIEALGMNFAEGTLFKSLVRLVQLRRNMGKPGSTRQYEAEKVLYYARRIHAQTGNATDLPSEEVLAILADLGKTTV